MKLPALKASLRLWLRRVTYRARKLETARRTGHKDHKLTPAEIARIHRWERLLSEARRAVDRREHQIASREPLRLRAYKIAEGLIGVMEQGGNNAGAMVSKIIHANGGGGPEAWCGDFQAYCYRLAGSKAVQRAWASVRAYLGLAGIKRVSNPQRGNLVRFTFDHIAMFDKDNGDGTITTIEGNTGPSGAVSDSATGGDGVYRKIRSKQLVRDYLDVTR